MGQPMPDGIRPNSKPRPAEWAITCPVAHCLAQPGARCTTPTGRPIAGGSHPSRLDTWITQQANNTSTTAPAA